VNWEIAVAGTAHHDDVATPHGRRQRQLGGSSVYFSLAAARRARIHLHAIVGTDFEGEARDAVRGLPVDLAGLTVSATPTHYSRALHDYQRWIAVELEAEAGCDPEWQPRLTPAARRAEVLFLGSMDPQLQLEVLAQSSARLIAADSMTCFTGPQQEQVLRVLDSADILFANRHELASLVAEVEPWQEAARCLLGRGRLRAVVVKAGPEGAAIVTRSTVVERPAAPVGVVMDPTGAGDALAGGFLGLCAARRRDDEGAFLEALEEGLLCAAAAVSAFGIHALRGIAVPG